MDHDPTTAADPLDAFLVSCDPVKPSALSTGDVERALDDIGAAITSGSLHPPQTTRKGPFRRPRAVIIAAVVVFAAATVAAAAALTAHTGTFNPTREQIAKASPDEAARMQSQLDMGGPGEFLDPSAPDFREVALQIASDIPYPGGYESWRDFLISEEIRLADGTATESSGALHGWLAGSAFCAWVQVWRQADLTGDAATATHAAQVISEAPGWKAVTDEDPQPDAAVPNDQGSTTFSLFGWMLPYGDAVAAGDRATVERLLSTGYGDKCWTSDPDWMAQFATHPEWGALSRHDMAARYEQFLAAQRS
jgi:hypothetical protein